MGNLGKHAEKGATPWNKGIPRTEEVKKKISEVRKKGFITGEITHPKGMLGKKHSQGTIEKIRKNSNTDEILKRKIEGTKRYHQQRRVLFVCLRCGKKDFVTRKRARTQKYCSNKCRYIARRNVYQRIVEQIRGLGKYEKWRTSIYGRDNYTCQKCKDKNKNRLNVHHNPSLSYLVKKYKINTVEKALKIKELWNKKNAITLCIDCHKKTDTYLTKKEFKAEREVIALEKKK